MRKYITICFIILITRSLDIYSQGSNSFINRTPDFPKITTPNAASFDKFIDNPVSLYNGSVDVSIPVYTLKDGDIELPITLRYNTSGIKVNEEASWVGLGWNLNVGGVITQNVVGDFDDMDSNYNTIIDKLGITNVYFPYYVPQFSSDWIKSFDEYTASGIGRSGRLNPDVFYYSYPGGGGKFIFDYRNDSIYILSRESAEKIEVLVKNSTSVPSIQEFKITTVSGVQHYFSYFTRMYSSNSLIISSVSYILDKTIYPNNQQVNYTYKSKAIRKASRSNIFQANLTTIEDHCDLAGYPVDFTTGDISEGAEFYLSNIRTTNYQINFETSERTDLMNGLRLNKIKLDGAAITKEFVFEYDYFTSDKGTIGWKHEGLDAPGMIFTESQNLQRLKLLTVYEQSGTNKINKYNFTYDAINLPAKTSYSMDYWGNYNGQKGSSYLPDLKRLLWGEIITNNDDGRSIKISEKYPGYVQYTNRGYDYSYCKAGTLTKITYPTGGTKEIIYEPNSFTHLGELPGARDYINTNTMSDYTMSVSDYNRAIGEKKAEAFTVTEKREGKLEIILSRGQHTGSYADGYYWWNLKGSKVTIINTNNGSMPVNYDLTDDCHIKGNCPNNPHCDNSNPGQLRLTLEIPSLTPGNYVISVNMTDNIPDQSIGSNGPAYANLRATLSMYHPQNVFTTLTPQEVNGCGIRVAQVINNFDNNNKTTTFFEYGNGILHDILQYVKVHDNVYLFYSGSCEVMDENGQMMSAFIRKKVIAEVFGNNTMSNPYASTGGVGYSSVKEITKSNNTDQGWIISEFKNTEPHFTQESVRIDHPLDGKLIKNTFFDTDSTINKEIRYDYSYNIAHRYFGINFRKNINAFTGVFATDGVSSWSTLNTGSNFYEYNVKNLFSIIAHPLDANDIRLNSVITTVNNVTITESYTYNPTTLQLTSKKMSKSDGNNLEYKYSYPNDYNFAPYTNMKVAHIYSPVIEEKIFNNNKYIGGTLNKYKATTQSSQTIYVPDKKYFSALSAPLSTAPATFSSSGENTTVYPFANVKYENQTAYGKPQSIAYNDADQIVYLWSYNYQYPIAEIKNATYTQVRDALGGQTVVDNIAKSVVLSDADKTKINNLRANAGLAGAHVTTYTYKPLVGILTATDPSGLTTTYEYDTFGRLIRIKDPAGKIIQSYNYHYQNQ